MLSKTKDYHQALCSLVIFRNIRKNPVIQHLEALFATLAAVPMNQTAAIDAYTAFAYNLFSQNEDFSAWLLNLILEDENFYMLAKAQNQSVSPMLEETLRQELSLLQEISSIDPMDIQTSIQYNGYLPCWKTSDYDFNTAYAYRMQQIHINGYGIFAKYHAFMIKDGLLTPIKHPDSVCLAELSGYERERKLVMDNTIALLEGKPAANTLLYGDAGTGKSSTIKAVANALYERGLRLIELTKEQLHEIPALLDSLSKNPLKFILFIDDLSFSSDDNDFAALKAILEGSISAKTSNLAIYVTSNRRHLVKESFIDRQGDDIHASDTREELLSLSDRFGLTITFSKPDKKHFDEIVLNLAKYYDISISSQELLIKAGAFAMRKSGYSPRTAKQFIESIRSREA